MWLLQSNHRCQVALLTNSPGETGRKCDSTLKWSRSAPKPETKNNPLLGLTLKCDQPNVNHFTLQTLTCEDVRATNWNWDIDHQSVILPSLRRCFNDLGPQNIQNPNWPCGRSFLLPLWGSMCGCYSIFPENHILIA